MALNLNCMILILLLINLSGSFQNHTHQNAPSQFPNHYFAPSGLFFLLPFDFIEACGDSWRPEAWKLVETWMVETQESEAMLRWFNWIFLILWAKWVLPFGDLLLALSWPMCCLPSRT